MFEKDCRWLKFFKIPFRDEADSTMISPKDESKFLVFESCLRELFRTCRECYAACKIVGHVKGTFLRIETLCTNDHRLTWDSQPIIKKKPAGNLFLSAAILFSGGSPTRALRMLQLINVQVMTSRTFFNYQKGYLLPAIKNVGPKLLEICLY